jgi:hypothetical protein
MANESGKYILNHYKEDDIKDIKSIRSDGLDQSHNKTI